MNGHFFQSVKSSIWLFLLIVFWHAFFAGDRVAAGPETGITPVLNETDSISGSFVVFDPAAAGESCFAPGIAQDFCFRAESFTNDSELIYDVWLRFPSDWVVNSVSLFGTPVCDNGSFFGLSYAIALPNVVKITHSRIMASTDHCTAHYLVNVIPGSTPIDAPVSWYYEGDGYGSTPHYPCSDDGYTPPGQPACDEAINPPALIPPCAVDPGIFLLPETQSASGCPGDSQIHELSVQNLTGSDGIFDLDYSISSGIGTLTGPSTISLLDNAIDVFQVTLTPDASLSSGELVIGLITVTGNSYTDTATINRTTISGEWEEMAIEPYSGRFDNAVVTYDNKIWSITGNGSDADVRHYSPDTDGWTTVINSAPSFGITYARSSACWGDKAYVYGDTTTDGFTGLWSYNMATNVWTNESPSGTPPVQSGIWAPAWSADTYSGLLYLTGGATIPGGGNLATVYVYDPTTNSWLAPLSDFTSPRYYHAAFIYIDPGTGHKLLAIAAGVGEATNYLSSTQCYDFVTGLWNSENANIPAVPVGFFGMGYTQRNNGRDGQELWLIGGIDAVGLINTSLNFNVDSGIWVDGGVYSTTPVFRNNAATLNGRVYKISGCSGGFEPTGLCSLMQECMPMETPTPTPECNNDGDVNLSGDVTAGDAQLAFLITLGMYPPTYTEECAADCNGDGEVTAGDAQAIFLKALGLGTCVDPL